MEKYRIKAGTVFTIKGDPFEYVISDLVNCEYNVKTNSFLEHDDPIVVFRSVNNINSKLPLWQQIGMLLSEYRTLCTEVPLTSRTGIYNEPLEEETK